MNEYAEIKTADGDVVLFEVDPEDYDGPVPAGRRLRKTLDRSSDTLQQGIDQVKKVANSVVEALTEISRTPDRVEVEIGLKVNAEANFAVAKSSGEAQIKITMEWSDLTSPPDVVEVSATSRGEAAEGDHG